MAKFITKRYQKLHETRSLGGDFVVERATEPGPGEASTSVTIDRSAKPEKKEGDSERTGQSGAGRGRSRRRGGRGRGRSKSSEENRVSESEVASSDSELESVRSEPPEPSGSPKPTKPPKPPKSSKSPKSPKAKVEKRHLSHEDWDPASYDAVPHVEGKTRFPDLPLPGEILHAVQDLGFEYATPIQAEILPELLDGRDAIGQAQTGTGKTAAFLSALFTNLLRNPPERDRPQGTPRALVLAPTRELAQQIERESKEIGKYTGFRSMAVFGGMDYVKQKRRLEEGAPVDIVVATPGRLLDFLRSRVIDLRGVESLVIDEADRMLDMGFVPDVRRIIRSTPPQHRRQTLFFSATFNDAVLKLADQWTDDPHKVVIEPESIAAETVDQTIFITTIREQLAIVVNLIKWEDPKRVLIFVNRRDQASSLYRKLTTFGISAAEMSGAVPQNKRQRVLEDFRSGKITALVATDVAGRGIHIDDIDFVINYHLPDDPEDYVHRIGRTGRAGAEGKAFSFASEDDGLLIPPIEDFIKMELPCIRPKDKWLVLPEATHKAPPEKRRRGSGGGGRRSGGNRSGGRRRSGGNRPRSGTRHH